MSSNNIIRIGDRIVNLDHYRQLYFYEDERTKPCIRGLVENLPVLETIYVGTKEDCMKILNYIRKKNKYEDIEVSDSNPIEGNP